MILGNKLPNTLSLILYYIGNYYLTYFLYLILSLPILDFIKFLYKKKKKSISNLNKYSFIILMIVITSLVAYGTYNAKNSYVKNYNITLNENGSNNLKIILLSDIHLGEDINSPQLVSLISEVNALNGDLVLIAGDLIDMSIDPFIEEEMYRLLSGFKTTYGTYFALGNHDIYDGNDDELTKLLENEGINVLRDESILVDDKFYIIGRDDKAISRFKESRKSLSEITSNIDSTKPTIVIDHTPDSIDESISSNIDIQVSGHTHKGQLFPGNFITSLIFPLDYGYKNIDGLNLVVSSGYGYWGPPIRLGSQSEIVSINVKF
ncbi:MAG: metallophosphoesterase [Clostridium sp.]